MEKISYGFEGLPEKVLVILSSGWSGTRRIGSCGVFKPIPLMMPVNHNQ
jgi:hypothetical protein